MHICNLFLQITFSDKRQEEYSVTLQRRLLNVEIGLTSQEQFV